MKAKIKLSLFLFFVTSSALCQNIASISKIDDEKVVNLLNNLSFLSENNSSTLSIRIFKVGNISGNTKKFAADEITHKLFIAVSESDEFPKQSLFSYGPIYNPSVIELIEKDSQHYLTIEFGNFSSRQRKTFKISIDQIKPEM